ncbi:hypothetical protein LuPra_01926 [Luteitalea pratensis]|uniref:Glyoxalase-like domain-containing protein n=1 Tax=Luteitalea pratensis TaxID=1855912 RepID=A0A143PJF6_LUTPR|nr:VOC family protein [Luteitalea pratensis]AMY08722.1 hypothetical protein LuPra_01926 [Luteitalea pratensis]
MELDHVFVMCDVGAPEAAALHALGLREGSPNTHPGQGTACRRFFFGNAYLELVWVANADEAQTPAVAPTRLWDRWSQRRRGASPFGIVLRGGRAASNAAPTWPTWPYRPSWLGEGQSIEFAQDTPLREPEIIAMPFVRERARAGLEPLDHDFPLTHITSTTCGLDAASQLSAASQALHASGIVSFEPAREPTLRLAFADAVEGKTMDLWPTLPLVLEW